MAEIVALEISLAGVDVSGEVQRDLPIPARYQADDSGRDEFKGHYL